ncbi:MAG: hypothetical protein JNK05_38480 [Myxococcales bacterium]|nr:hypothetical protein [Myxococcales bacterium]
MRSVSLGICCLVAACGVDPSMNGDATPIDARTSSMQDGSNGMDSTTQPSDVPSFDASSAIDTGVGAPLDSGIAMDSTSSRDSGSPRDTGLPMDVRAADVRSDTGTSDVRVADVASMPDVPSPRDVPVVDVPPPIDASGGGVVDYTARGYYRRVGGVSTFTAGVPSGFVRLPAGLTYTQLGQLHQDCIDRINQYRAGTIRFSNGSSDPGVPRTALNHLMGNNACSTAQALGDMVVNGGAGGCAGAHTTSFSCPWTGTVGQNTCCMRSGATYAEIRAQMYSCLQLMWDEGIGMPSNAAYTSANGHWYNMRNSAFTQVSCGFAFDNRGRVWMNQDFSGGRPASVAQRCACTASGAPDGCGGTCVAGP